MSKGREKGAFHYQRSKDTAHDHVVFHFEDGPRVIYNDPRRFGLMTLIASHELESHELFADLGVEPLSAEFDAAALAQILDGVRAPLKSALLDQRRIAGLGNIYVCEALHRAKLSPLREAGSTPRAKIKALHTAIRAVLEEAIEAGGSTLRDHAEPMASSAISSIPSPSMTAKAWRASAKVAAAPSRVSRKAGGRRFIARSANCSRGIGDGFAFIRDIVLVGPGAAI